MSRSMITVEQTFLGTRTERQEFVKGDENQLRYA